MRVMIAFFALSITSPAIAQTDLTGIWFGGLSDGRGQVALSPEFVDDMVKVELDFRNWAQDGFGKCIFYGRVDAAGTAELILNTGAGGTRPDCPRSATLQANRASPGSVTATIAGFATIPPTQTFELDEVIRPIDPSEYATMNPNFDILGTTLGQTRAEIEANLIAERGYIHDFERDQPFRTALWTAMDVTYRKGERGATLDQIIVSYSAETADADQMQAQAVIVHRAVEFGGTEQLLGDTLRGALERKYGPSIASANDNARLYDRQGQNIPRRGDTAIFCEPGTRQAVQYQNGRGQGRLDSHCGTSLEVAIRDDFQTGLVRQYYLTLQGVDWLNNDFWDRLAFQRREEFSNFLVAIEGATDEGPEL
jgi:hypothetical protein